ncbi:MAG: YciI family protein [Actinomycetota bacterium]|nr:YciI family protein [Actinomycetota bacterium]
MVPEEPVHLLLYDYVPDMAERRGPHRESHLARISVEREAGRIAWAGAFDPPSGAAIVFTGVDREEVEAFVAADPYRHAGLIASWRVERWKLV